jgi:hypothetical protein
MDYKELFHWLLYIVFWGKKKRLQATLRLKNRQRWFCFFDKAPLRFTNKPEWNIYKKVDFSGFKSSILVSNFFRL